MFPKHWQVKPAHLICKKIVDCVNKTAPVVNYETEFKMIRTSNVKKGFVNHEGMRSVSEATFLKWNRRLTPKKGDIVLTREAPLGDVGLIRTNHQFFLGQRTMIYRADGINLNQRFLYYTLTGEYLQAQFKALGSGSTVEHIRVPDAEKVLIPYPPLDEQIKIASILSAYDDLFEANKKRIQILEDMAEELYKEWFVRFRFPNWENAEFDKGIPDDWREVSLGSICKVVMGQSPKSEYYNEDGVGLPFHQGVGTYGERFPISRTFCSVSGRTAYTNDILFSVRAPVGRLNIANTKMIIGRGLSAFSSLDSYNDYLYYLLHHSFEREDIIGNGAIFNSVTKDELLGFKILYPSDDLLKSFNELARSFNSMIKTLYDTNEDLSTQKNNLLPRLMSGKLSVADLDIHYPPSMQKNDETEEK